MFIYKLKVLPIYRWTECHHIEKQISAGIRYIRCQFPMICFSLCIILIKKNSIRIICFYLFVFTYLSFRFIYNDKN